MVTVTRNRDPLEGQCLRVLGRLRRHGSLELLLVLADGSKRLVPASWTDLDTPARADAAGATVDGLDPGEPVSGLGAQQRATAGADATLGAVGDLLAAQILVTALIHASREAGGRQAARTSSCEEDVHAACSTESAPPGASGATRSGAGPVTGSRSSGGGEAAGAPDRRGARRWAGGSR